MPIATPEAYAEMLGRAKEHAYAFPAVNCTSSETVNAALKGFADAGSDGIIQFSTGGAEFGSGLGVKDMVTGAVALAEFAHVVAEKYPITVALHTDHCPKDKLDTYVRPLLDISSERVRAGQNPLFQSHMWDGSAVPIDENLSIAQELLKQAAAAKIILEIEIGVVGGEEDGVEAEINDKLYTTPEDFDAVMNVNLRAAYFLSTAAADQMIAAGRPGSIIHVSSQRGNGSGISRGGYCASKHALEGMVKAMAIEWGPKAVRINTLCPTFIRTPLGEQTLSDPARLAWIEEKIKLGRVGEIEDIMGPVVCLASDASAMVTGTALMVDGGWTAE